MCKLVKMIKRVICLSKTNGSIQIAAVVFVSLMQVTALEC